MRPIGAVVKDYQASSWNALSAPARTPREIVNKLSIEANAILKKPDVIEKFRAIGSEPVGGTPADVEKFSSRSACAGSRPSRWRKLQKM